MNGKKSALSLAIGSAFAVSLAASPIANAAENPFGMSALKSGYILADASDKKMPEGKCGDMASIIPLGFDPAKNRFVGTFIASMMEHLWIYDGELDAAGTTLSLYADGPSFTEPGKTAKYKDAIEMKSDDHYVFTGGVYGEDGAWICFMTANYHRVK